jgi:hypothetical protein
VVRAFATKSGLQRELVDRYLWWKTLPFERVFQLGVWFDTLKNRVVTSSVIGSFGESRSIQIIEESLDTAQIKE